MCISSYRGVRKSACKLLEFPISSAVNARLSSAAFHSVVPYRWIPTLTSSSFSNMDPFSITAGVANALPLVFKIVKGIADIKKAVGEVAQSFVLERLAVVRSNLPVCKNRWLVRAVCLRQNSSDLMGSRSFWGRLKQLHNFVEVNCPQGLMKPQNVSCIRCAN